MNPGPAYGKSSFLAETPSPPGGTETLKLPAKVKRTEPHAPRAAPVPTVHKEGAVQTRRPVMGSKPAPARHTAQAKPVHSSEGQKPGAVHKNATAVAGAKPAPAKQAVQAKPAQPIAGAPAPPVASQAAQSSPAPPPEPPKGTVTGLPLPRYAALRSDEVNLRSGPGTRYPIDWVYKRRDLPVEIDREFEVWRLIKDEDGVKGWVHQATLTGRRSFVVVGAERTLRSEAKDDAAPVAFLKPGVVGRLRSCEPAQSWCEVQVGDYRGWLKRGEFWGSYPGEAINP